MKTISKCSNIIDVFKNTMSRVGSQAMILTGGTKDVNSQLHGMTLSSVSSLSVYPRPLVQFNLHLPSYTSLVINENKYLGIHLLPPTSKSVFLGRTFASGIKSNNDSRLLKYTDLEAKDGEVFHEMTTPFSKIEKTDWKFHKINEINIPILNESENVLICKVDQNIVVDNHEIWVAEVLDILLPNSHYQKTPPSGGLIYCERGFHRIGEVL